MDLPNALTVDITTRRAAIAAAILDLRDPKLLFPVADSQQFILGFLHLVEHAAAGDVGAREDYLAAVIPGLRGSGFGLEATLESMIRASMALITQLPPEHHRWIIGFCGNYVRRLLQVWEHRV